MNSDSTKPQTAIPQLTPSAIPPSPTPPSDGFEDDDDLRPRVLVVCVGQVEYGIPVAQVREVFRGERVTQVPGAPVLVRGIVNVRGAVVTVLELSGLLGLPRAVTSTSVVLLEHGSRLIGLAVDAVRDVRVQEVTSTEPVEAAEHASVVSLDAVALCAPHLLSSEEIGQ